MYIYIYIYNLKNDEKELSTNEDDGMVTFPDRPKRFKLIALHRLHC